MTGEVGSACREDPSTALRVGPTSGLAVVCVPTYRAVAIRTAAV